MDFRWAILIALWTFLSGPILARPLPLGSETHQSAQAVTAASPPAQAPTR